MLIVLNLLLKYILLISVDFRLLLTDSKLLTKNSIRIFLGMHKYNSTSQMYANLNIPFFCELIRKYAFSFMNKIMPSKNVYFVVRCNSTV